MMYLFVRTSDGKITTVFDGSAEDAKVSCPASHRIEEYHKILDGMMSYAYYQNGDVYYSKSEIDVKSEEAWRAFRSERDQMLSASDWTQATDAPVDRAAWAAYRQALRDLPANTADPRSPQWPSPPE